MLAFFRFLKTPALAPSDQPVEEPVASAERNAAPSSGDVQRASEPRQLEGVIVPKYR